MPQSSGITKAPSQVPCTKAWAFRDMPLCLEADISLPVPSPHQQACHALHSSSSPRDVSSTAGHHRLLLEAVLFVRDGWPLNVRFCALEEHSTRSWERVFPGKLLQQQAPTELSRVGLPQH